MYIYTGTLTRFVEKNTASKIDILLTNKKGPLYPTAIILAAEVYIYIYIYIYIYNAYVYLLCIYCIKK
jgi:hypothetical protein